MRASPALSTLLLPLLLAGPLILAAPLSSILARSAVSINSAIDTVESQIAALNRTLNGFAPRQPTAIFTVLEILKQTTALGKDISAATAAANASQPLNESDSLAVGLKTLDLEPMILGPLDNIVAKKPAFDTAVLGLASVGPTVERTLVRQRELSRELANAVAARLDPALAGLAAPVSQQIAAAFDRAIADYSVPGGLLQLPPLGGGGLFGW